MTTLKTVEEADAQPEGVKVADGWGEEWERRADGWVHEVWCSSEELIGESSPVTVLDDEDDEEPA